MDFAHVIFSNGARLNVEVPETDREREVGLMGRTDLLDTDGMLFDFERDMHPQLWMKNMRIPIDMIFINSVGVVVDARENVQPGNETRQSTWFPARYVLEVPAGWVERFRILGGHTMTFG